MGPVFGVPELMEFTRSCRVGSLNVSLLFLKQQMFAQFVAHIRCTVML